MYAFFSLKCTCQVLTQSLSLSLTSVQIIIFSSFCCLYGDTVHITYNSLIWGAQLSASAGPQTHAAVNTVLFYFFLATYHGACGILSSPIRDWTQLQQWKPEILITRPPGNSRPQSVLENLHHVKKKACTLELSPPAHQPLLLLNHQS